MRWRRGWALGRAMTDPKDITSMFRKAIAALDARDHANAPRWQGWFLCPCCKYPTLTVREAYEVCPLCRWEDDGQDDADADTLSPDAPNGRTLTKARANFAAHLDQFDADNRPKTLAGPNPTRLHLLAYVTRVQAGEKLGIDPFHTLLAAADE